MDPFQPLDAAAPFDEGSAESGLLDPALAPRRCRWDPPAPPFCCCFARKARASLETAAAKSKAARGGGSSTIGVFAAHASSFSLSRWLGALGGDGRLDAALGFHRLCVVPSDVFSPPARWDAAARSPTSPAFPSSSLSGSLRSLCGLMVRPDGRGTPPGAGLSLLGGLGASVTPLMSTVSLFPQLVRETLSLNQLVNQHVTESSDSNTLQKRDGHPGYVSEKFTFYELFLCFSRLLFIGPDNVFPRRSVRAEKGRC